MHKVYSIKAGDSLPRLEIEPVDRHGNPLDFAALGITSADITISTGIGHRPFVKGPAMLAGNLVYYEWSPNQTLGREGDYLLEVIFKDANGRQMTVPGAGYGTLVITPRL